MSTNAGDSSRGGRIALDLARRAGPPLAAMTVLWAATPAAGGVAPGTAPGATLPGTTAPGTTPSGTTRTGTILPGSTLPANPVAGIAHDVSELGKGCKPDSSWVCERVFDWTGNRTAADAAELVIPRLVAVIGVVAVAWAVNRVARWFITRAVRRLLSGERRHGRFRRTLAQVTPSILQAEGDSRSRAEARSQTLIAVICSVVSVVIWTIAVLVVLSVVGINVLTLLAATGVLGVALGFGAQNVVRDFLAGFFIVLEDQFGVGDIVDLGEAKGTVEGISLRATRVRDVHGVLWHVPNGQIQRVANKSQEWARAVLDIEVPMDTDLDTAQQLIQATADAVAADEAWSGEILEAPEVWGVESFTASGMVIRLVVKTQPASQFGVMRELRGRLKDAFDEAGMELPGARNVVYVRSDTDGGSSDPDGDGSPATPPSGPSELEPPEGDPPGATPGDAPRHRRRGDASEAG